MKNKPFRAMVIVGALLFSGCAVAAEFSVAGIKLDLPGEGWAPLVSANKALAYGGDFQGSLDTVRQAFVKRSVDQSVDAVVVLESSASTVETSRGQMAYSPKCEGASDFYADGNSGFNRPFAKCMRITKLFTAASLFGAFAPDTQQQLAADGVAIPNVMRAFTAYYANSYGVFLTVSVLVPPTFEGLGSGGDEATPPGIGASNVRWGEALMDAVEGGVNSWSRKVKLPALGS